jgi:hypothetical protein
MCERKYAVRDVLCRSAFPVAAVDVPEKDLEAELVSDPLDALVDTEERWPEKAAIAVCRAVGDLEPDAALGDERVREVDVRQRVIADAMTFVAGPFDEVGTLLHPATGRKEQRLDLEVPEEVEELRRLPAILRAVVEGENDARAFAGLHGFRGWNQGAKARVGDVVATEGHLQLVHRARAPAIGTELERAIVDEARSRGSGRLDRERAFPQRLGDGCVEADEKRRIDGDAFACGKDALDAGKDESSFGLPSGCFGGSARGDDARKGIASGFCTRCGGEQEKRDRLRQPAHESMVVSGRSRHKRISMRRPVLGFLVFVVGCQARQDDAGPPRQTRVVAASASDTASAVPSETAPPLASASSSPRTPRIPPAPEPAPALPQALLDALPKPLLSQHAGFEGPVDPKKDREWVARLASAPIVAIKRNTGGMGLTLRVRFADGQRAVWKPDQKKGAGSFRSEIAAWHLDRLLGFGRTAVVVGRSIGKSHVLAQLDHADTAPEAMARFEAELVEHDGRVQGAMIAWHDRTLANAEPPKNWEWPDAGVTEARIFEWSDMVAFDFLIDNTDRWSGGNVLSLGKDGPLVFLDNAAGFSPGRAQRNEMLSSRLESVCRFRPKTEDSLTRLAEKETLGSALLSSLAHDPLAPVLSERHATALDGRLGKLVEHFRACD